MKSSAARLSLLGTRDKLAQMSVDALADLETAKTEIIAAKAQMSAEIV